MDETTKQLIEFAQQFFGIANAITAFAVLQAVALMYAFKDTKLGAAFLRWRPFTSLLSKHAGTGYIIAVIVCGIAEFWLRTAANQVANQKAAFLGACVIAVALRCVAIYVTASVYLRAFVAICREQDWLNKNKLSNGEKRLHKLAMKVDEKLFGAPLEEVVRAEDFDK
jgi:hypothetical protein